MVNIRNPFLPIPQKEEAERIPLHIELFPPDELPIPQEEKKEEQSIIIIELF